MHICKVGWAIEGANPELKHQRIDGESDPEGDAEELAGEEMGGGRGREKDAHHGAGGRDAEKNGNGAKQPSAFQGRIAAVAMRERAYQRVEKQSVEEKDGRTFNPSSDGKRVHGIRGQGNDCAQREEDIFGPAEVRESPEDCQRSDENEEQSGNNVRQSEGRVGGEGFVEAGHLRRAVVCRGGQCDESAKDNRDGDQGADPKADAEP